MTQSYQLHSTAAEYRHSDIIKMFFDYFQSASWCNSTAELFSFEWCINISFNCEQKCQEVQVRKKCCFFALGRRVIMNFISNWALFRKMLCWTSIESDTRQISSEVLDELTEKKINRRTSLPASAERLKITTWKFNASINPSRWSERNEVMGKFKALGRWKFEKMIFRSREVHCQSFLYN